MDNGERVLPDCSAKGRCGLGRHRAEQGAQLAREVFEAPLAKLRPCVLQRRERGSGGKSHSVAIGNRGRGGARAIEHLEHWREAREARFPALHKPTFVVLQLAKQTAAALTRAHPPHTSTRIDFLMI